MRVLQCLDFLATHICIGPWKISIAQERGALHSRTGQGHPQVTQAPRAPLPAGHFERFQVFARNSTWQSTENVRKGQGCGEGFRWKINGKQTLGCLNAKWSPASSLRNSALASEPLEIQPLLWENNFWFLSLPSFYKGQVLSAKWNLWCKSMVFITRIVHANWTRSTTAVDSLTSLAWTSNSL